MSPTTAKKVKEIQETIAERVSPDIVLPEHDEYGHKYRHTPTNQLFASVTTKTGILANERLKRWASKLAVDYIDRNWDIITPANKPAHFKAAILAHEDEFQDAGDIGTRGHEVVERYLLRWIETGERPDDIRHFIIGEDARLWAISRSAEKFCHDFDVIPIASELLVASERHKYAGTLDSLMMIRKGDKHVFALVDWKTSNSVDKPEYAMQVSAYWHALNEMTRRNPKLARTGLSPSELIIVQLDKKQMKYVVVKIVSRPDSFRAYKHVCKVYDYLHDGKSKIYPYTTKKERFL